MFFPILSRVKLGRQYKLIIKSLTDLIWSDLKPLIFPSRNIGYWQSPSNPLCLWTGVPADDRKDLSTGWHGQCLSSSCCAIFLLVYLPAGSNKELAGPMQ